MVKKNVTSLLICMMHMQFVHISHLSDLFDMIYRLLNEVQYRHSCITRIPALIIEPDKSVQ